MDGQQQHIQLALPSPADATPPTMETNDGARLAPMCPSLYLAAYRGRTEEVMALLLQQHGAAGYQATGIIQHGQCDILEVSAERNTVFHVAAEQGHDELIRELYLRFREQVLLSRRNSALDTPLHCTARAGHVRAVAVLVQLARDCGENILGCKNEAGDTALHLAARHGHGGAVEVLVSAAAEPAAEENNAGMSPLYLAVMSGSVQAVRAIIRACKDASSDGPSSQNALHAAVFQSSEMIHLLLEWRPTLADQVDSSGSSPLHFAASDGNRKIVKAILCAAPPGAVYRKDSCGGLSALHVAARMGHHRVVKDLLQIYPDAGELRDNDGSTFVHAAAREKRSKVVYLAVKDPMLHSLLNAQDRDGNTPLHLAVAAGAPGVVEALLRKGKVRADVLNNDGRTAFDLAAGSTHFFTMVSLVVTLVAYRAQLRPQRQDHLKQWSGGDMAEGIDKTSESLSVVAVLIATAAFAAGFNVPGGYSDTTGEANLADKPSFKSFLFLDTLAMATSVIAVILLVYGRVSRSAAGSWKSFAAALHFMWVSLISLMVAFYAALVSVVTTRAVNQSGWWAIYVCVAILNFIIATWVGPEAKMRTLLRFLQSSFSRGRGRCAIIKRQYPLAGASVFNCFLFTATSFLGLYGFVVLFFRKDGKLGTSPAPSPL
ncbi:unnamed protein product [Urochloa decumbens]|uniref:PGG domain-containing protein n=1 Tax=Urochloa decumbens TaxID=240449 RepID=A0ABC9BA13_9POAL